MDNCGVPASVNFGIFVNPVKRAGTHRIRGQNNGDDVLLSRQIDDEWLPDYHPDYYNDALRQFFKCYLNFTSI